MRVRHVHFDGVYNELCARTGVADFDPALWSESRELILAAVRRHFALPASTADAGVWLATSSAAASDSIDAAPSLDELGESVVAGESSGRCFEVVVLDDNMQCAQ